ncbi:MAG: hypothetical protein QOF21_2504, partial [Actinomycetota bacterium]
QFEDFTLEAPMEHPPEEVVMDIDWTDPEPEP